MQRGIFAFREVHTAMGDVRVITTKFRVEFYKAGQSESIYSHEKLTENSGSKYLFST